MDPLEDIWLARGKKRLIFLKKKKTLKTKPTHFASLNMQKGTRRGNCGRFRSCGPVFIKSLD